MHTAPALASQCLNPSPGSFVHAGMGSAPAEQLVALHHHSLGLSGSEKCKAEKGKEKVLASVGQVNDLKMM